MLGENVGRAFARREWVGIPFAGGMAELPHIDCRTGVANDLHRGVINLAKAVADPVMGPRLIRHLRRLPFHPDTLADAQARCRRREEIDRPRPDSMPDFDFAADYFVCAWMSRAGQAGTTGELRGGISFRWNAAGGDSVKRFRSATDSLREWRQVFARWTFDCRDAFDFMLKCKDDPHHGVYCDPPFPGPGDAYKHTFGEAGQRRLADMLAEYRKTRVLCRFYDVPLIRELYPEPAWTWHLLEGRKQTNDAAPEVLLVRN